MFNSQTGTCSGNDDLDLKIKNCDIYNSETRSCEECEPDYVLLLSKNSQKCIFKEEEDYLCQVKTAKGCSQCYLYGYMDLDYKCHLRSEYQRYLFIFVGVFGFVIVMALVMCNYRRLKNRRARAQLRTNLLT